jgi:hypothetical protein|nr:MAG TPA: hypothetical protein [Caudoviricetes sp.]
MKEFSSLSKLVDYLEEHRYLLKKPYLIEIEYSKSNWSKVYPLNERIYQTTTICDYFDGEKHSSLIGSTKSGSEYMVNLSQYNWRVAKIILHDEKPLR